MISLVLGPEKQFFSGGKPPDGVSLIASHPYCDHVSNVPPTWPPEGTPAGSRYRSYITTMPLRPAAPRTSSSAKPATTPDARNQYVPSGLIDAEQTFINDLKTTTCGADSPSGFPTFLFAYSDVCPATGCRAGCDDPNVPTEGNGYFGIFHTKNYPTPGRPRLEVQAAALSCQ